MPLDIPTPTRRLRLRLRWHVVLEYHENFKSMKRTFEPQTTQMQPPQRCWTAAGKQSFADLDSTLEPARRLLCQAMADGAKYREVQGNNKGV